MLVEANESKIKQKKHSETICVVNLFVFKDLYP